MTRALLCLALLSTPALAGEVLVLTTATRVDTGLNLRKGLEIQNLGPNAIYCAFDSVAATAAAAAVVTKARKLDTGAAWAIDLPAGFKVYCIAATANQVTGAATIVTEVR
jgi:hypothetical protein